MRNRIQFVQKLEKVNLLALDVGTRFIGIAIVNDAFGTGVPYPVWTIDKRQSDFITEITSNLSDIHGIVVGMPTNPDFHDFINTTIRSLTLNINLPFVLMNEDYSNFEAMRLLKKIHPSYVGSKFWKDQVSACIILNRFIKQAKHLIKSLPKPLGYKID